FFYCYFDHRVLHSFPTRRSSDLHYFGTTQDAYLSDSYTALPPDGFTFRSGVTTVVDAGGAGWRNFLDFKNKTFANSKTRMFAFLDRKSTRLNSSHLVISYAVFCL